MRVCMRVCVSLQLSSAFFFFARVYVRVRVFAALIGREQEHPTDLSFLHREQQWQVVVVVVVVLLQPQFMD